MNVLQRIVLAGAGAVVACATTVAPAGAAAPDRPCSESDARTLFQAFYPAAFVSQGIHDLVERCQYRLSWDGQTVTFSEDDVFVGGVNWVYPYAEAGVTQKEARAEISMNVDRVWIAPVLPDGSLGELVEQEVHESAIKTFNHHASLGEVVYQNVSIWTQLPAGTYVSIWENTFQGETFTSTVTLVITPAE